MECEVRGLDTYVRWDKRGRWKGDDITEDKIKREISMLSANTRRSTNSHGKAREGD